jgi:hypothetical protein
MFSERIRQHLSTTLPPPKPQPPRRPEHASDLQRSTYLGLGAPSGGERPAGDSDSASQEAGHDPHSDAIVVAMAEAFRRNTAMGEAFLADQTPAMRERYRNEVADAQERIHRRHTATKTT